MPHKLIDLTGKIFGRLTSLRFSRLHKGNSYWIFRCECGTELERHATSVSRGNVKSCGCLLKAKALVNRSKPPTKSAVSAIKCQYLKNARIRNLAYSLSDEEFEFLIKQNCFYCGTEPSNFVKRKGKVAELKYNGIDRFNNSAGYSVDNCKTCCRTCNWAKGRKDGHEFIDYIDKLIKYRTLKCIR